MKEIQGIEVAIKRLPPGREARAEWLSKPGIQTLPMKFVFTVKPTTLQRVIVYVDDFMICGPREVVQELSEAIQEVWETSVVFSGSTQLYKIPGYGAEA